MEQQQSQNTRIIILQKQEKTKNQHVQKIGIRTLRCSCGETITQTLKKTGHSFGEWIIEKVATVDEEGLKARICKNCNTKETKEVEKLPKDKEENGNTGEVIVPVPDPIVPTDPTPVEPKDPEPVVDQVTSEETEDPETPLKADLIVSNQEPKSNDNSIE